MSPSYIIDTGVWISHLLAPGRTPSKAVHKARETGRILLSTDLFIELRDALTRTKFRKYITLQESAAFLKDLLQGVELIEVSTRVTICRDPDDDKLLALAQQQSATAIVTGDRDLLILDPFGRTAIVTPQQFVKSR